MPLFLNQLQPAQGVHANQHLVALSRRIDKDGQIVQGQWSHRQRFDGAVADPDLTRSRVDLTAAAGCQTQPLGNLLRDGDTGGAGIEQQLHPVAVDGTLQTIVAAGIGLQQQFAAGGD